jgi:hypothetical protein
VPSPRVWLAEPAGLRVSFNGKDFHSLPVIDTDRSHFTLPDLFCPAAEPVMLKKFTDLAGNAGAPPAPE